MEPTQHARSESSAQARIAELETELAVARRQLTDAQEVARIGSWEWDIPHDVVWWSDQLYRIYGLEPQELVPSYDHFLRYVHPDDRDAVDQRNRKAFADHEPFEDVKRVVREDGREILMRTQGEVVCDPEGKPMRMVGVCEDVTDQVQARVAERERAATDALRRRAYEINDEIIQRLVVASMYLGRGATEQAASAIADATSRAQEIVRDYLVVSDLRPGDLRREDPADRDGA